MNIYTDTYHLRYQCLERKEAINSEHTSYSKNSLAFEPYLKIANPEKRRLIAQFRTSAHRLHIETGRFGHNNTYVPPDRRLCECCSMGQTEDEFHFLIECPKYLPLRTELFSSAGELNKYFDRYSPELKFVWIMSNENENVINQLGTFLIDAFRMRNHLMTELMNT